MRKILVYCRVAPEKMVLDTLRHVLTFLDVFQNTQTHVTQMSLDDGALRHCSDVWKANVKRSQNHHRRGRTVYSRTAGPPSKFTW